MSSIRKQTIISSILVYAGFVIGAVNMFLYTKNGFFSAEQFGLTTIFFSFSQAALVFSCFGSSWIIQKFYPYYKDNLQPKEIDVLTWALIISLIGFIIVCIIGFFIEPLIIKKYATKSPLILPFFGLLFPFAFGALLFTVLEAYALSLRKPIVTSFLRETLFKFINFIIIILFCTGIIGFKGFMYLFSTMYLLISVVLLFYLFKTNQLHLSFSISRVTKKFWKKMIKMQAIIYFGSLVIAIGATIDAFVINEVLGLTAVGYFTFAQYGSSLIQVPFRTIQNVSIPVMAQAWKDKNFIEIKRVYSRSCINLLLLSLFIFGNIWLNVLPAINLFGIQEGFQVALSTLFIFGITRCIDAATGINNIVLGTSLFWRIDFLTSALLLLLRLPLTWFFIKRYGIIGSAMADLIAVTAYNFFRYEFLRRKFNMQPFTLNNLWAILLAIGAYFICFYSTFMIDGIVGMIVRTVVFSGLMIGGIFILKLTPDAAQMYEHWVLKKRKS